MASIIQSFRILGTAHERQTIGFGNAGSFDVLTQYNVFNDTFTLTLLSGATELISQVALLPGILLNVYTPAASRALQGDIWIDGDIVPGARQIGGNINLIYESEPF